MLGTPDQFCLTYIFVGLSVEKAHDWPINCKKQICLYKFVLSLHSERQPPNLALNPRTKSNSRTVLGLGLQPQNVLVFGGLQHASAQCHVKDDCTKSQ